MILVVTKYMVSNKINHMSYLTCPHNPLQSVNIHINIDAPNVGIAKIIAINVNVFVFKMFLFYKKYQVFSTHPKYQSKINPVLSKYSFINNPAFSTKTQNNVLCVSQTLSRVA